MHTLRTSLPQVRRGKWMVLTLGIIFAVTSPLRAAVLFSDNFNSYTAGGAGADFTAVYNLSAGSVVIGTGGGLGGSQSVQTTTATAVRLSPIINTGSGDLTIDLYFQWFGPNSGAARPQIGLVKTTTGVMNGTSDLSARIGGGGTLELRANGAGITSDAVNMDTLLTNNNWYLFRFSISQTASSGVFSNSIAVYNSDTNGNVGTFVRGLTNSALSNPTYYNQSTTYAAFRHTSLNPNLDNFSVSQTPPPSATIAIAGTLGALRTIVGTASSSNVFTVSGVNLTGAPGNLTVTPPAGFEVSRTNDSGYSTNSLSVPYSGATLAGTNLYVRLAATTAAGTYSGNITVVGGGDSKAIGTAASMVYPVGSTFLFADDYTVSAQSVLLDFENTLGRQTGSLSNLPYLARYTGAQAYKQNVGNSTWIPANTNALLFFEDAGARIDYDFSTNAGPLEIRYSVIFNWFGIPNTNSFIVGSSTNDFDPTNTAFAFQLRRNGTTSVFDHGIETNGTSGTGFSDNVLVNYMVVLSDTNGTGSAFGSGGSMAAYYQNGILLGTATFGQLTAGEGYIGFVGGIGYNGIDDLQITALPAPAPSALPPAITAIAPNSGRTNGGTVVTITGSNFLSGVTVQFGANAGTSVVVTGTTNISVTTPANAPGLVDVIVLNTNALSATNTFTYVLPPPPATIVPGSVVKSGSNLNMVWAGGTNADCTLLSATNLNPAVWVPVATNTVGANGLSTNVLPVNPGEPKRFYLLSIPYN